MARAQVIGHQNIFTEAMSNAGNLVTQALQVANQRRQIEYIHQRDTAKEILGILQKKAETTLGGMQAIIQDEGNAALMETALKNLGISDRTNRASMIKGLQAGQFRYLDAYEIMLTKEFMNPNEAEQVIETYIKKVVEDEKSSAQAKAAEAGGGTSAPTPSQLPPSDDELKASLGPTPGAQGPLTGYTPTPTGRREALPADLVPAGSATQPLGKMPSEDLRTTGALESPGVQAPPKLERAGDVIMGESFQREYGIRGLEGVLEATVGDRDFYLRNRDKIIDFTLKLNGYKSVEDMNAAFRSGKLKGIRLLPDRATWQFYTGPDGVRKFDPLVNKIRDLEERK